tara:strand:- start:88 stop:669 length:582 start_codon:yes stop_codon:yes gene_type:complete
MKKNDTTFDGIILLDKVIKPSLAKDLISYIDTSNDLLEEKYGDSSNVQCEYLNISDIRNPKTKEKLDGELFKTVGKIIQKIWDDNKILSRSDTGYCLRRIHGRTRLHTDGVLGYGNNKNSETVSTKSIRNMSVIIALNDDYEGGEFNFPNQNKKIKLKKYQAIAFPPYWTHPHEVSAPKKGTFRYTINTWLCE